MENHAENMHQKLVPDLPFYVNNPKHPHYMQEIILIRYFERGLSKNLKKINSISSFEPSPFRLQNKFRNLY